MTHYCACLNTYHHYSLLKILYVEKGCFLSDLEKIRIKHLQNKGLSPRNMSDDNVTFADVLGVPH